MTTTVSNAISSLSRFPHWNLVLMYALFAALFTLEMMGVFKSSSFVTITKIIRAYVPVWARAMICGWLCWHFVVEQ